jgi:hypothetical protein
MNPRLKGAATVLGAAVLLAPPIAGLLTFMTRLGLGWWSNGDGSTDLVGIAGTHVLRIDFEHFGLASGHGFSACHQRCQRGIRLGLLPRRRRRFSRRTGADHVGRSGVAPYLSCSRHSIDPPCGAEVGAVPIGSQAPGHAWLLFRLGTEQDLIGDGRLAQRP